MARKRTSRAPKRVKGLPKGGALYSSSARKTAANMQKQYGSRWKNIFFGLANKRAGKGVKGKERMHSVASKAFAKGSNWRGRGGRRKTGSGRRRVKVRH